MRLLVTRPAPDGERTAGRLRADGHDAVVVPVLRTQLIAAPFGPGPFSGVVMTSANAARAVADHAHRCELTGLPVFVVGGRTAEAARQSGFSDVLSADGDVNDLIALLATRFPGGGTRLLYLAGEDRAGDLAGGLSAHGIAVETAVVYRTVPEDDGPQALAAVFAAGGVDGVLHYSRRSAEAFVAAAKSAGILAATLVIDHFCLSADIAAVLSQAGARRTRAAPHPDEVSLFTLIAGP